MVAVLHKVVAAHMEVVADRLLEEDHLNTPEEEAPDPMLQGRTVPDLVRRMAAGLLGCQDLAGILPAGIGLVACHTAADSSAAGRELDNCYGVDVGSDVLRGSWARWQVEERGFGTHSVVRRGVGKGTRQVVGMRRRDMRWREWRCRCPP